MGDGHKIFWAGPGCCTYELVEVATALTGPSLALAGQGPCMEGGGGECVWPLAGQPLAPGYWEAGSGGLWWSNHTWHSLVPGGKERGKKKRKARHWVDGEEVVERRALEGFCV